MLALENADEILEMLDRFTKQKPTEIPPELNEYIRYVAKTGDTVYHWPSIQYLFREKLLSVIKDFHDTTSNVEELPPCPNVDQFNYEAMKTLLFTRFDRFQAAPFTIQRLSELLVHPKKHYTRLDKFMRALEKNILVVSTIEPGRPPVDLEENGEDNGAIVADFSLDADADKPLAKLDGEEANGIVNHSNVDVEAIDEMASSSGVRDALNDIASDKATVTKAEPDAVPTADDATAVAKADIDKITDSAMSFMHQVCYETISNDSADNTELDLSVSHHKEAIREGGDTPEKVVADGDGEKVDADAASDETKEKIENADMKDPEQVEADPVADSKIETVTTEQPAVEHADGENLIENNSDDVGQSGRSTEPPKSSDSPEAGTFNETEIEMGIVQGAVRGEHLEEAVENVVTLPPEPVVEERSLLSTCSESGTTAEPTHEPSATDTEEAAPIKPLTPKRSRDFETDDYDAKKVKSNSDDNDKVVELQGLDLVVPKVQQPAVGAVDKAKDLDKTDWETASLEEYIPPHFKGDQENAAAASTADASKESVATTEEAATSADITSPAEIGVDEPSISVEPTKSTEPDSIAEPSEEQLPASETVEDKMNEDTPPAGPTGDEMNVEEADPNIAMDAAPIKPDIEQMDVDDGSSMESMDL